MQTILNLGKESLFYGLGSVMTRLLSLISVSVLTSYLTPDLFGVFAMLTLLTLVAQSIFCLGLDAAFGLSYFELDTKINKSKALWSVFLLSFISSTVLFLISYIYSDYLCILINIPLNYSNLVILSFISCCTVIVSTAFIQRLQFEKKAKYIVNVNIFSMFTNISIAIFTVIVYDWGLKGVILGQLAGNLINFISFLILGSRETYLVFDFLMIKQLFIRGVLLIPSFASLLVIMHANKFILEYLMGLDAVGIYSVGFNFGMIISVLTGGFISTWYPFFMSYLGRQEEIKDIFSRIFIYYVLIIGLTCILFYLFAKPFILIITGEKFHMAYVIVGLVASANFVQTFFNLFLPGIYFNNDTKYMSLILFLSAIISIPLSYLSIEFFGIIGAGIGLVISNLIIVGLTYLWNYINKGKYPKINYEWARVLYLISYAILIISTYLNISVSTLYYEVLKSILFSLISFICVFSILKKEERVYISQFLK